MMLAGCATVVIGAVLTAGTVLLLQAPDSSTTADATVEESADDGAIAQAADDTAQSPQRRLLLITSETEEGPATSVTLIAGPSTDTPASVLFLPTSTLVSTPGFGLDQLGYAHRYGGPELLAAAVENALSVRIDHVATVTDPAFAEFLDRAGELDIALDERVVQRSDDGSATVLFDRGTQTLTGRGLADLWLHRSSADDEFDAFSRRREVVEPLLTAASDSRVRDRLVADGAPQLRTEADAEWLREWLSGLAEARSDDRVRFNVLPVERFGSAGADGARAYRIHEQDTERLVRDLLGGSQDLGSVSTLRAQVLNGVGTPGVGQMVERKLPGDVQLVLTGNANRFDHTQTRILVYEESSDVLAAAQRLREALGTGTIQVSRQPQSIVDLTIVVGADLLADDETAAKRLDGSESTD